MRPGLVVVPTAGLDSLRTIVQRDLDFSDQFELVILPASARESTGGLSSGSSAKPAPLNYSLYRSLGASYAVECYPGGGSGRVAVRLHDVGGATIRREGTFAIPEPWEPGFRQAVHRLSDEVVRWITGVPGFAATQIAFVADKRIWRVDTDGAGLSALTQSRRGAALADLVAGRAAHRLHDVRRRPGQHRGPDAGDGSQGDGPHHRTQPEHHAGLLSRRAHARVRPLERGRNRHLHRGHDRALLRAALDRGPLCGQLIPDLRARRPSDGVRLDARRAAADLLDGGGWHRPGVAGAVRLRHHRAAPTRPTGRRTAPASSSTGTWARRCRSSCSTWPAGGSGS